MATAVVTQTQPAALELQDSSNSSLSQCHTSGSQLSDLRGSRLGSAETDRNSPEDEEVNLSRTRASILITTLTGLTFVGSMSSGLLTIGLPWIAADLKLPDSLLLWYVLSICYWHWISTKAFVIE